MSHPFTPHPIACAYSTPQVHDACGCAADGSQRARPRRAGAVRRTSRGGQPAQARPHEGARQFPRGQARPLSSGEWTTKREGGGHDVVNEPVSSRSDFCHGRHADDVRVIFLCRSGRPGARRGLVFSCVFPRFRFGTILPKRRHLHAPTWTLQRQTRQACCTAACAFICELKSLGAQVCRRLLCASVPLVSSSCPPQLH